MAKILVVDDEKPITDIEKFNLEKECYQVSVAYDGEEAVEFVTANEVNIILMDLEMPIMDGYEALAEIRAMDDESKSKLPIIALTGHAGAEQLKKALDAGFDTLISKPYSPEQFKEIISSQFSE